MVFVKLAAIAGACYTVWRIVDGQKVNPADGLRAVLVLLAFLNRWSR
jgi:hypothetical protein